MAKFSVGDLRNRMFLLAQQFAHQMAGPYMKIKVVYPKNAETFVVDDITVFAREKPLAEMPVEELQLRIHALTGILDYHRDESMETKKVLYSKTAEVFVAVVNPMNGISGIIPVSPHGSEGYAQFDFTLVEDAVVIEDTENSETPPVLAVLGRTTTTPNDDHACAFKTEEEAKVWIAVHPAVIKAAMDAENE